MVGGFLGAGKTTTLGRLARVYQERGLKVGVVTNDQATDLVDTNQLRAQGLTVGEVAGACFCCNFNELMSTIDRLGEAARPDVILAEPVGSCTDLVATVIQPLKRLYDAEFSIAPYAVILKPSHGRKILKGESAGGFSPKAEYILRKQLEEADVVLVNRIDELLSSEAEELEALVKANHPRTPVLRVAARTGQGFDALLAFLDQEGDFGRKILDIDYDVYAEGEAELGWLNGAVHVTSPKRFPLDDLLLGIVEALQTSLRKVEAEPAHLKTIGLWEGFFGVANLIASEAAAEMSLPSRCEVDEADVIVNARVACDPAVLEVHVRKAVADVCDRLGATPEFRETQSFRPGRPVPTHRYADAV
jgi:Ni2+-binding GTPase involved in maturation of urease and hydrogenase